MYNGKTDGKAPSIPIRDGQGIPVARTGENDALLPLDYLFKVVRKRLTTVLAVTVLLTGTVVAFSLMQTPIYEASIKILIGQERGITETPTDVMGLQQLTETMANGVDSRPVAEAVIAQRNLQTSPDDFLDDLDAEVVSSTQFVEVTYSSSNAETAQRVVNTIGDVFSQRVSEVSRNANAITATVWESAGRPEEPVSPNPLRNGLIGLLLGLMLGGGLALLLEYLDESWQSPEELEQISRVPMYGVVPAFNVAKQRKEKRP